MNAPARAALFVAGLAFSAMATAQTATVPLKDVAAIAQGPEHACALAFSRKLYCWGNNTRGQLGDGSVNGRSVAAPVVGLDVVNVFAVGGNSDNNNTERYGHTCAVTGDGRGVVNCWGANESGQLGDGTSTDRLTPLTVGGLPPVVQVVAGGRHTCVLTYGGVAKCWGSNDLGQLGDGTTVSRATPTDVVGLASGVRSLVAAYKHTCALMNDGSVKCWGSNITGELGDGTTTNRLVPTTVVEFPRGRRFVHCRPAAAVQPPSVRSQGRCSASLPAPRPVQRPPTWGPIAGAKGTRRRSSAPPG